MAVPDTGSVLQYHNPDGTALTRSSQQGSATILQELAFNEYGDLFTGDNNSDSSDKARWVYVVEEGDSGWRIGYQFIESPYSRGPWNEERLWYPAFAGQAAYIVPPIANIADGPSGLTYDPGVTLLSAAFKNHFFAGRLPWFERSEQDSHLLASSPREPRSQLDQSPAIHLVGAGDQTPILDPDGALYFSDWVEGWEMTRKGRIYRVLDPSRRNDPHVREVKMLLAQGMASRSNDAALPVYWPTRTCGFARRRSSNWWVGVRKG